MSSEPTSFSTEGNKCIRHHIINTNNIDLDKDLSILTSKDIQKCKKTWKGKECK